MAMDKTRVVHCKRDKYDVYIGRPSLFGNPFPLKMERDREQVISQYSAYFDRRIETDPGFRRAVQGLRGKVLGCWCKPKACHGDVIARWLDAKDPERPTAGSEGR